MTEQNILLCSLPLYSIKVKSLAANSEIYIESLLKFLNTLACWTSSI